MKTHHPHHFFIAFALSVIILPAAPLHAAAPRRGWILGPAIIGRGGESCEIVRARSSPGGRNRYLSFLRWDIKPALTVGILSRWNSGGNHAFDFAFHAAVPGLPSGEMNDFDWLFTDRDWSHWSVSDITLTWGFILDIDWEWTPVRRGPLSIILGAGYHLDWWSWSDTTRHSVYSTLAQGRRYPRPFDSDPPLPHQFRNRRNMLSAGVNSINYSAAYHVPLGTIGIGLEIRQFFIRTRFRIGPALGLSHDHHRLRNLKGGGGGLHFYDFGFGGPWTDMAVEIGFRTPRGFSLRLLFDYVRLGEFKADTVTVPTDGSPPAVSPGSAALAFWRLSAGITASWSITKMRRHP